MEIELGKNSQFFVEITIMTSPPIYICTYLVAAAGGRDGGDLWLSDHRLHRNGTDLIVAFRLDNFLGEFMIHIWYGDELRFISCAK